jgi:hypothetical protein
MNRFLGVLVLLLIAAGAAGYFWLTHEQRSRLESQEQTAKLQAQTMQAGADTAARQLAGDLTTILATGISGDLLRGDYGTLQNEVDAMVHGHRVVRIIVLGSGGQVVATTDRRYAGRGAEEPGNRLAAGVDSLTVISEDLAPGVIELDSPVLADGQRVGSVRVFVNVSVEPRESAQGSQNPSD